MNKASYKAIVFFLLIFSISACVNLDNKKIGSSPGSFLKNIFNREAPSVTGVRMRPADEASRVEIAASAPFKYVSYRFHNPERLVIEMRNVDNSIIGDILLKEDAIVKKIEMVNFEKSGKVRAVIYLKEPFAYDLEMKGAVLKIAIMPDESEVIQAYRSKLESARKKIAWLEMELRRYRGKEDDGSADSGIDVAPPQPIKNSKDDEVLVAPDDITAEMMAEGDLESLKESERKKSDEAPVAVTVKTSQRESQEELLGGVRDAIEGWLDAWNKKDIRSYSSYYDASFESNGQTREVWLAAKKIIFREAGKISVLANKVDLKSEGDRVKVTFIQSYTSKSFGDRGVKILELKKNENEWKIVSELWRAIK